MFEKDWLRFRESGRHPLACTCFQCNEGGGRTPPKTFSEWCGSCGHQESAHAPSLVPGPKCAVQNCHCEAYESAKRV